MRYVILLVAGTLFYASFGWGALVILTGEILLGYICGIRLGKICGHPACPEGKENLSDPLQHGFAGRSGATLLVAVSIVLVLCPLIVLKYRPIWERILGGGKITGPFFSAEWIAPIGISFYTLRMIGYLADVYRGTTSAEKNFLRFALFVSFFPCVLSGPIERYQDLAVQFREDIPFSETAVKKGFLQILFGFFEKYLIADRLALMVSYAFADAESQSGIVMIYTLILYGIQLYADFAGYSYIAIGTANLFGIRLKNNFEQPYFAVSIQDFWRRWHISLSSWLRDYVYIPLGGSRKGRFRTYCNLMITFLVSGLWHGVGLKYILWGGLHGFYQIVGKLVSRGTKTGLFRRSGQKAGGGTGIRDRVLHLTRILITFVLVDYAWLYFRADSISSALRITKAFVMQPGLSEWFRYDQYLLGMTADRLILLAAECLIMLVIDLIHERKISISAALMSKNRVLRWGLVTVACLIVLTGLVYNYGTDASVFIYTQF